jgi:hypothetical protein
VNISAVHKTGQLKPVLCSVTPQHPASIRVTNEPTIVIYIGAGNEQREVSITPTPYRHIAWISMWQRTLDELPGKISQFNIIGGLQQMIAFDQITEQVVVLSNFL